MKLVAKLLTGIGVLVGLGYLCCREMCIRDSHWPGGKLPAGSPPLHSGGGDLSLDAAHTLSLIHI